MKTNKTSIKGLGLKYVASLCLLLLMTALYSVNAQGQSTTCKGRVVDSLAKGIGYVVVQVKGKNQGMYTDEQGAFSITADAKDTLIFYCTGYEKRMIAVKGCPLPTVQLTQQNNLLGEVVISSKKKKQSHGRLGKRSRKYGDAYFGPGYEIGLYFDGSEVTNGQLSSIYMYVRDKGSVTNNFRVHVYEADTLTKLPKRDITNSNLIVHAPKGEDWMEIDVSDKHIPVKNGIIITMEWIGGYVSDNKKMKVSESDATDYQGQVLGLTQYNGWQFQYSSNMFLNKRSTGLVPLTPMIYCTYSYPK